MQNLEIKNEDEEEILDINKCWLIHDLENISYDKSWKKIFQKEFKKSYFNDLQKFLSNQIETFGAYRGIFPPRDLVFNAFKHTTFDKLSVVIIGQDPYINVGEAMGLCFSVPNNVKIPPSLQNIYTEIANELNINMKNRNGDLSNWAKQGILLLNCSLTVREGNSNSHSKYWKEFTDNIIKFLSDKKENIIFLLWGNFAKNKKALINQDKHYILESTHPSPLSANRGGWFGNGHFIKVNEILKNLNKDVIDW
tara:strand:- start:59 stop:814 length:756 start_codon:yes stop_codon:yes gene_type:complete